jgi:SAM-dependent methyltransferase
VPVVHRALATARFGSLKRTSPLSEWGNDRGTPVDRWYIERFLDQHRALVSGSVLEVKADEYATQLGAKDVDVIDIDSTNPRATIVGDLCDPGVLPKGRFDAAVITQTLQFVEDPAAAVRNLLSSLRPGGTLLVTVPSVSRLCGDADRWRWVPVGFRQVLEDVAPARAVLEVVGLGNSLAGRAFLFGLAVQDLDAGALAAEDDQYPLLVAACVRIP